MGFKLKTDIELKLLKEKQNLMKEAPNLVNEFIEKINSETTIKTQIAYLRDLLIFFDFLKELPYFMDKDIKTITAEDLKAVERKDIRDFINNYLLYYKRTFRNKAGSIVTQIFSNSEKGRARKLATLRSFYDWLIDEVDDSTIDVTKNIKVKTKKENTADEINRLQSDEMALFIDTILEDKNIEDKRSLKLHQKLKLRDYTIISVLGLTGIRISELVNLDIDDIFLDKAVMRVDRKGKKTDIVILPKILVEILSEYLITRNKI